MSELVLQEFLHEAYRKRFEESEWAEPVVRQILDDYGITQNAGNLLLGIKTDEEAVALTFISNGDLFMYTISLERYTQYFKVLRNVKDLDFRADKNYNIVEERIWYNHLFIGGETFPVITSMYVGEFIEKLINY